MKLFLAISFILGGFVVRTDGQCTWPDAFKGTTWTDIEKGELVFGETTMTGWTFQVDGQVRNEWKCVKADTFEEDGYLLMVTTTSFVQFVTAHYFAYLCLKTKKITDVSYRYYIEAPIQRNVDYERILVYPYDTQTSVASVCFPDIGASGSEYKLLIKSGSETAASIQCPYTFLGIYDYTHTAADGRESCTDGNNLWDMCSDNSRMQFNLAQCPTKVSYSGSPDMMCVDTVPINQNNYVTVYNYQDASVDGVTTFRYSCFGISADGTQASVAPKYCRRYQTPDSVPVSNSNVPVGATMTIPTTYTTCPTCPVPESPDGGSVYVQTDGAVTSAIYTCAEDYSLYGAAVRTCLSDNTWELEIPACKCNEPIPPANGEVSVSNDGIVASYVCHAGYILNGNSERYCQDDGKAWNGTDPTCDICDTLVGPEDGTVTVSQQGATSKASYTCKAGYTLAGVKERICLNGGAWTSSEPTCILCATLSPPVLGTVNIITDGYISEANFTCMAGYVLSERKSLSCQTDGTWDSTEPHCICEALPPLGNGSVVTSSDGKTTTYSCNAGFSLNGSAVRVCLMDGTAWNGIVPVCVKCPDLPELPDGLVEFSVLGPETVASFTCGSGYTMSGRTNLTCNTTGSWDGKMPVCVFCEARNQPSSGTVTIESNGTTSTAIYECSLGYTLSGSNITSCLTNGVWDLPAPNCYCNTPSVPFNGRMSISEDKFTASYQCDVGYSISGSSERLCQGDGKGWTGSEPSCSPCQTLPNLPGGGVSLVSTGTATQANFTCDVGYTMNGGSLLSCRSDGFWDLEAPSCVLCKVPSAPSDGGFYQETNGRVTTTVFTCPRGYGLSGRRTADCRSDGTWDYSGPVCVECPALLSPDSGSVLVSTNGSSSIAMFSCVAGYSIKGKSELFCGSTGAWNDDSPLCVCDDPPSPAHGNVSADGSVAIYTCYSGYSLSGSSTRKCADNGAGWSGTEPFCVICEELDSPPNGSVSLITDGVSTTAEFTCDVGFTVDGSNIAVCQIHGMWNTIPPDCVLCDHLIAPKSGLYSLATNGTVTSASFSCISGYYTFGLSNIECTSDGSWNNDVPTCACDIPVAPANGTLQLSADSLTVTYSCDAGYTLVGTITRACQPLGLSWSDTSPNCVACSVELSSYGLSSEFLSNGTVSMVTFSCMDGYTISGPQSATCQTDGQLDQQQPSCVECARINTPTSGNISISTNGTTSIAEYTCAEGYSGVGDALRTCGEDGQWDGTDIVCLCDEPPTPVNGNMTISSDGLKASYICDTGYILVGDSVRLCSDDGQGWSGDEPSCSTCDSIQIPSRGSINLLSDGSNTLAIFTCSLGSSLLGNPVLTCLEDGTWNLSPPKCTPCPTLSDPNSGNVELSTDGQISKAEFSCVDGYYLSGNSKLLCLTTGNWSDSIPHCVCDPPKAVVNGQRKLLENGTIVTYTCDLNYSLKGDSELLCGMDGSGWTGADPACVPCPTLNNPDGGSFTTITNGISTTATFVCETKYSMKGPQYLACLTDGDWNDTEPTCVSCPNLSPPLSGSVNVTSTGILTTATYSCYSGYRLLGPSDRKCSDSGVWDSADPRCVCKPPNTPTNGLISVSEDGMAITYTCNTGYSLEGAQTRLCQNDGTGWDESDPICNRCEAVDNLNGGYITMTTDGSESNAIYSCDVGFSMDGGSSLTCRSDGSWDVSPPECISCQSQEVPVGGDVIMSTDGEITTATYTCAVGYTLQGRSNLTCRGDGSWDYVTPSCVKCLPLSVPDSGSYVPTTDGRVSVASFFCANNYSIIGFNQLMCDISGEWSSEKPVCVCDKPPPPLQGSVSADGLIAIYRCNSGYSLQGPTERHCSSDGTWWNGTAPICVQCVTVVSPQNGSLAFESDGVTTKVEFYCASGFTLRGIRSATCSEDGSWNDGNSSVCVECQTLKTPTSGSFTIATNGTVSFAEFTCLPGYRINGQSKLACNDSGFWDTSEPFCVCEKPAVPKNGSVTLSDDKLTAKFFCDIGFSLSGTEMLLCEPGGPGWNDVYPTCSECIGPPLTPGLNFTLSTNGTVTMVTYYCDPGYTMTGVQYSHCQSDGAFNSLSPFCVLCTNLNGPSSGTLEIKTNATVSQATYSCVSGYTLIGNSVRLCNEGGVWSGHDAKCLCELPILPTNGSMMVSEDGQTIRYACNVGFILIGNASRTCSANGTGWTGSDPFCFMCEPLEAPSGGIITLFTDDFVTTAQVTCSAGASVFGASLLACQIDGLWDISVPTCVHCPALTDPDSGTVTVSTDGKVSVAEFFCNTSYYIVGSATLTCQINGIWHASSPTCVCNPPSVPDNGKILISEDGFTVSYECDAGYTLVGDFKRKCSSNGTGWTGTHPDCVSCPSLNSPINGNISISTDGQKSTAAFQCDIGFSIAGATHVECHNGAWNDSAPICVLCPVVTSPDSGSVFISTNGVLTKVTYQCAMGYQLIGNVSSICLSSGVWSEDAPNCVCQPPASPNNGKITVAQDGMTIHYSCQTGYSLLGVETSYCKSDGSGWDGPTPSCIACDTLQNLAGGTILQTTDGTATKALFSCDTGYSMNGKAELVCRSDGTWNMSQPSCTSCQSLQVPIDGDVLLLSDGRTTTASFVCSNGYSLKGVNNISCRSDGTWDYVSPTCTKCPELTSPESGSYILLTDGITTKANFSCSSGYDVNGSSILACDVYGEWADEEPLCKCNRLSPPDGGQVVHSLDGMTAVYSCPSGFTLDGVKTRICRTDGTGWTGNAPVCVKCQELDDISNGYITMATDSISAVAVFSCNVGYSLYGSSSAVCGLDGVWNTALPTCVICPNLSRPANGDVNLTVEDAITKAAFSCRVGFTVSGNVTLTCGSDGLWSSPEPVCVGCPPALNPTSGTAFITTNGTTTTASFECSGGYYLKGTSEIVCLSEGIWNNGAPSCICDKPAAPDNGTVWVSADGMTAVFACDLGFSMDGVNTSSCSDDAAGWSSIVPTCVECQTLLTVEYGNHQLVTQGSVTKAVITCDEGYSLKGSSEITCQTSGFWDVQTIATCVHCEDLPAISSGSVTISTNGVITFASYSCSAGYQLIGDSTRSCGEDGSWSNTKPVCSCVHPATPSSGNIVVSDDNATATTTCDAGYTLTGPALRTCREDGSGWSGVEPTCTTCATLSTPAGGTVQLLSDGMVTSASYSCNLGYSMSGQGLSKCRSDGTWDITSPSCVLCENLPDPLNGILEYSTDGVNSVGTIECDAGYTMNGARVLSCLFDGRWNDSIPSCVSCPTLIAPDNGQIDILTDGVTSKAVFSCLSGYELQGWESLVCGTDGVWNHNTPKCNCMLPLPVGNGIFVISVDSKRVNYFCDVGYTLNGSSVRNCQTDGNGWDGIQPSCTSCEVVASPGNGTVLLQTNGVITGAIFECDVGFSINLASTIKCLPDGSWDSTFPECLQCEMTNNPNNGTVYIQTNGTMTTATYSCDVGYSLSNPSQGLITCRSDGSWNADAPTCTKCNDSLSVANGILALSANGTSTLATFECVFGYYLSGESELTCEGNGLWNSPQPVCLCNPPPAPTNGNISSDGNTAIYKCNQGYSMNGMHTRLCSRDGLGWNGNPPVCTICQSLSAIEEASYSLTTDGVTTTASFSCPLGQSIRGNITSSCNTEGVWDSDVPSCVKCQDLNTIRNGEMNLTTDTTSTYVSYICAENYYLIGSSIRTCLDSGLWDDMDPRCVCNPPDPPFHGYAILSDDKNSAAFECEPGYTIKGHSTLTCSDDGAGWNNEVPTCNICDTLPTPVGASVEVTFEGTVSIARYTCDNGYTISGLSSLFCRSDGTWNISAPTCTSCPSLSRPANGKVEVKTTGIVSTAYYSCDFGYALDGQDVDCQSDGTWEREPPECVACPAATTPASGMIWQWSDGIQMFTNITCTGGYYLQGEALLICDSIGAWNHELPSCYCNQPSIPEFGSMEIRPDKVTAIFTCEKGYTLNGAAMLSCQSDGSGWDGVEPICALCDSVASVENGSSFLSTNGTTTVSKFQCDEGTTMNGNSVSTCGADGVWSASFPTCVTCPALAPPTNGSRYIATDGINTKTTFGCDQGFTLKGRSEAVCTSPGIWDSEPPICVQCVALELPSSGTIMITTNGSVTLATFACPVSYDLVGSSVLVCRTDGTWDHSEPNCVCSAPFNLDNGNYTLSEDGISTNYACQVGYTLVGNATRDCAADGTGWKGATPVCVACQSPPGIVAGSFMHQTDGKTSILLYSCPLGQSLNGSEKLTCQTDGLWDTIAPTCVSCSALEDLPSGSYVTSTNGTFTVVNYFCKPGYDLNGSTTRVCLSDGVWESSTPECRCQNPESPLNGNVYSNGSTAVYSCDSGYSLNGDVTRHCPKDGVGWSGSGPTCVPCSTISVPTGGNITFYTDGQFTTVSIDCEIGYSLNGSKTLRCLSDGTWNTEPPTCGVPCTTLVTPNNGSVTLMSDGSTTTADFDCNVGSTLKGSNTIRCRADGSWDFKEATCVSCPQLPNPPSGEVSVTSDGVKSVAQFSCAEGYYLEGPPEVVCTEDGLWNVTSPVCKCNLPTTRGNGSLLLSEDGLTLTFSCESGYTLKGFSQMTCLDDGSGYDSSIPECVRCEELPALPNGVHHLTTDTVSSSATLSCDTGYSLNGPAVLYCSANGTWDITITPECVSCPRLSTQNNGSVITSTDGTVTSTTFACDVGFSLRGNSKAVCQTDGTWDIDMPSCVYCRTLLSPDSGTVDISSDGFRTEANFSCQFGYYLVGEETLHCFENGNWNAEEPICVCNEPYQPSNGETIVSDSGYTVLYTCHLGYSLSGVSSRHCQSNGAGWEGSDPRCVLCLAPDVVTNAEILMSTNGLSTVASYKCYNGFSLKGAPELFCAADGTWNSSAPECIECPMLSPAESGSLNQSTNGQTTVVFYTCAEGYVLQGVNNLTCKADGTWSDSEPSCVCAMPLKPANGDVIADGITANYSCDEGFTMHGVRMRYCGSAGSGWNGSAPDCIPCNAIDTNTNALVTLESDGTVTKVMYSCEVGYSLLGAASSTCRSDGSWDFTTPSCVACETLSIPDNGQVTLTTDNTTTSADYTCALGYSLKGIPLLTCRGDGTWDFSAPMCVACRPLSILSSGGFNISTNGITSSTTFSCMPGYYLSGSETVICLPSGEWKSNGTQCKCILPEKPANGTLSTENENTTILYTCDVGYSMNGSSKRHCLEDGSGWDGTDPKCISCSTLPDIIYGNLVMTSDGTRTNVSIQCDVGSSVNGSLSVTCNEYGAWETTIPSCAACPTLSNLTNGALQVVTDGTISYALFTCELNYTLVGRQNIACGSDGEWEESVPECSVCDSITEIDSGLVHISTNGSVTTASFSCYENYYVHGQQELHCLTDGTWSSAIPYCVCSDPGLVDNGDVELSMDGFQAKYICHNGYSLQGAALRACQHSGSGWSPDAPTCVACDEMPPQQNGIVTKHTNGTVTKAVFSCDIGFSLRGNVELDCLQDGTWNMSFPTCVMCAELLEPESGNMSLLSDGIHTKVSYYCAEGYILEGSSERICDMDGNWVSPSPICKCAQPASPTHGEVTISTNGSVASYSCSVGYSLAGATRRYCQRGGGGWTNSQPLCVLCDSLATPSGGTLDLKTNGHQTIAEFTCDNGYSLDGSVSAMCREDGTWNTTGTFCNACNILTPPIGGSVSVTTDGVSTSATFKCMNGYTLVGSSYIVCRSSGEWDLLSPSCVKCPDLQSPSSGQFIVTTDGFMSVATFECSSGYYIYGTSNITCEVEGSWSASEPECRCLPAVSSDSSVMSISTDGSKIAYACKTGYSLQGPTELICLNDGRGWDTHAPNCSKCEDLKPPANGSFQLLSNGLETKAVLLCNLGSTVYGVQQLLCSPDGLWTSTLPSCVACPILSDVNNGTVNISTDGSVTVASFTCESGYTLNGPPQLACGVDGQWDIAKPRCSKCTLPKQPSSGEMALTSNGTHTFAMYSCTNGYNVLGAQEIICMSNGTWDQAEPHCICEEPPFILNGNIGISSDKTVATYHCNSGFTLSTWPTRVCKSDGTGWSGDEPLCVKCEELSNPAGGYIELTSAGQETFASINCSEGYTISGRSELTCRSDGTWDVAVPGCAICDAINKPDNGQVQILSDGKTTTAKIYCALGYTISGSSKLTCRADGGWDYILPNCVKCPELSAPANGNMSVTTNGIATTASFSCADSYQIFGRDTLICGSSGDWDYVQPLCVCQPPLSVTDGGFNLSDDMMALTYYCEIGFTLKGNNSRNCDTKGSGWINEEPECIKCDDIEDPVNGTSIMSTNGSASYKVFICKAGSTMNGSAVVSCGTDGSWTQNTPTCVSCPSLLSPNAGIVIINTDGITSHASFTCSSGYKLIGETNITCLPSATWNYEASTCVCEEPPNPVNGRISISVTKMLVEYTCEESYTLKGNKTRRCDENGNGWDGVEPICVKCETLDITSSLTIEYSSDGIHSLATFTCGSGYTLLGSTVLSCGENGSWNTETTPICVSCPEAVSPTAGAFVVTTNGTTSKAEYSCLSGYHVVGKSVLECRNDGLWDQPAPTCHCDSPSNITFGSVISDGITATYTCLSGYTLNGNINRNCQSSGNGWDGVAPICVPCVPVNSSEDGSVTVTTNGTTTKAIYECTIGYSLKGTSVISCLDDGIWEDSTPICVSCPRLNEIDSGNISMKSDGQVTFAIFSCLDGYVISGAALLTCNSEGHWDSNEPFCVCKMSSLPSGDVVLSDDQVIAKYSCDVGHSLRGFPERTCLPNGGGWNHEEPECVQCHYLSADVDNITLSFEGTQSSAYFSCNPGSSLSGTPSLRCNSSGVWVGEQPACVACPTLSSLSSGSVTIISDGITTSAAYSCSMGYILKGQSFSVCSTDGNWTSAQPQCVCIEPPFIANGEFELSYNDTVATYRCDAGYSLQGSSERVCQHDGTGWNTPSPTCAKCVTFETFSNGNITISTTGLKTEARFTCQDGCSLNGQPKLICQSDGTWDFQTPSCLCCSTIATISSGSFNVSSNGLTTTVSFTCDNKYKRIGEELLTCRSDGLWDYEQPNCICKTPGELLNGQVTVNEDSSTANYICDTGFSLHGKSNRACLKDGSGWEGEDPVCSKCNNTSAPASGTIILSSNGINSFATIICDYGYTLTGETRLTCNAAGHWDKDIPLCVKCPSLEASTGLRYNVSSDGIMTTVTLECASGLEITGQTKLTCLKNGSWDAAQPTCNEIVETTTEPLTCEPVSSSSGAVIGVAVVLSLIIVALMIALAIIGRLYRRLHKETVRGKSLMYTAEGKKAGAPQTKGSGPGLESEMTKLSLSTFDDIEIFSKATAPVSHRRHVLEMGRTQSSLAPSEHQKHLLELAGQTSSPAPLSHISGRMPNQSPTRASIGFRHKGASSSHSPSVLNASPYEASLLTPTSSRGLKGYSATPSPVPSIEGPEYDTHLPQQILTPREVPSVDRVSPMPTPSADKKLNGEENSKEGSVSPKASKRKKHPKKHKDGGAYSPRKRHSDSQTKVSRSVKLSGIDPKDAEA